MINDFTLDLSSLTLLFGSLILKLKFLYVETEISLH